jgi:hypothetical protein
MSKCPAQAVAQPVEHLGRGGAGLEHDVGAKTTFMPLVTVHTQVMAVADPGAVTMWRRTSARSTPLGVALSSTSTASRSSLWGADIQVHHAATS